MKEILTIYNYVDGQNDVPFFDSKRPIKITEYSVSSQRMSSSSITASFAYPAVLDDLWDGNQYVIFRGLKYFLKNTPTSSKDNTDARYNYNVEFVPRRELQLANVYFYDAVSGNAEVDDKYKSNSTKVVFYGTINEFAARLQASLQYCGLSDYAVIVDEGIVSEAKQVSFEDKTFFEALQESYDQWGVPFYFVGQNEIHFGDASNEIETVFKYGIENSLLSIKKENADYQIVNRCTATGSSDNIPYYYPNNSPKGNIEAKVLSSNSKLEQGDIRIKDYDKFSANVEASDTVVWRAAAVSSHTIQVNGEGQYSGQERSVSIVNMQPVIDRFVVNFTVASEGRIIISTDMVRNLMDIGSALSAGVITDYGLVSVDSPLSYVTVSDNGDGTLVTSWLEKGNYILILVYTLAHVGVNEYTYSTNITLSGKAEWSRQRDGESTAIDLADIGISVDVVPSNGDGFVQNLINKITPSSVLLPPIYRKSLGAERFYDAKNNTYTDSGTGEFYKFENEYTPNNPREYITENEDIKPTINGITNAAGQEIGRFLEVAYDYNDSDETDEEGNYLHPYFFVKLPKFDGPWGFNLFDHAIENGEMTIAMTSGNCGACKFTIGVSDDDAQKNLVQVDAEGNLLRDENGDVRCGREGKPGETPQERQNDTENYEVWIALKKEESTFGVIMPNVENNYKPQAGDRFVILYISLPQAYIDKAEQNLEDFIIRYMADNNSDRFDFSIEFSRIYIAEHPDIAAALDENSKVKVEYNGKTYSFFVSQWTYKANDDESLPEIKVELSDTISIDKGVLEQTVAGIEMSVGKQVSNIDFLGYGRNYFLGKNYNDTANGIITFLRGLVIGDPRNGNGFVPRGKDVVGTLNSLGLNGNFNKSALTISRGHIEGFRTGLRRIITDAALATTDYLVLVENANDSTIKLPSNPEDGQSYRIHNAGYSQIIIDGNGKFITRSGNSAGTQTVDKGETAMIEVFFSSIVNQWYMSYSTDSFFARDENGDIYVKNGKGLYTESFMSARGKDPEAGNGSGTGGLDVDALWNILGASTGEQINVSHIPSLSIDKITGLQDELDSKLESITKEMVESVLTGDITSHYHSQYAIADDYYNKTEIDNKLSSALTYKGSVQTYANLPSSGNKKGDTWNVVEPYGDNYAWNGTGWDKLGGTYDFSIYALKTDLTSINSSISTLQSYFTNGAAKKVANALTIVHDGGNASASAKTYNGSAAVTVNIPTTLPASDVYDWAKQPEKPSYNFSEIGNKPNTLEGYGITDGVNEVTANNNLSGSVSGHSLTIGIKSGYALPSSTQIALWDKICALFGVDTDGNVYVTNNKGFYSNSFISAKGTDSEADGGSGAGINEDDLWTILGRASDNLIDESHIPSIGTSKVTGLDTSLSALSSSISTNASAIQGNTAKISTLEAYFTNGVANNAATAAKLGTSNVGGTAQGIYLNGGTATALSATVGSAVQPVYMKNGVITAGTYAFGNASGNAALNNGTFNVNLNADMLDGHHANYFRDGGELDWDSTYAASILHYNNNSVGDNPYSLIGGNQATVIQVILGDTFRYGAQLAIGFNYNRLAWRKRKANEDGTYGWDSWQLVSAGSLVNARTLWGQPFDGTKDVTGTLSLANAGIYWREPRFGDKFCIIPYFSGSDDSNKLLIQSAVGGSGTDPELATIITITGKSGKVGIGRTPSYQLDVNGNGRFSSELALSSTLTAYGLATFNGGVKTNTITLVNGDKTANISLDADGHIHATAGLYSDSFLSAKGKDAESDSVGEEAAYLPEITVTKLPKGQSVTLTQLAAAGFTSKVIADIQAGKVTHIKAVYLLGDVEIWPVQGAGKNFFIVGYECQSPSYMDMMEWYEVSNLENDGQIVAEFFER